MVVTAAEKNIVETAKKSMIMDPQLEVVEQVDQVALEVGVIKVDHVEEVVSCFGIGVNHYLSVVTVQIKVMTELRLLNCGFVKTYC